MLYNVFSKRNLSPLTISKIIIVVFSAIFLIGNFQPFYSGIDSYVYGITAIELSHGSYEISNELLEQTGRWEFVPHQWVKTDNDSYIPIIAVGLPIVAAFSYLVGGNYGLFYLGPIFTVALLIISERFSTNLFGEKVGFIVLLLFSTNFMIFSLGTQLGTDIPFALFTMLGFFYLIKFFRDKKEKYILVTTLFFVISATLRFVGLVFIPLEISLLGCFFVYQIIKEKDHSTNTRSYLSLIKICVKKIPNKRNAKIFFLMIIPWIAFLIFFLSFNNYYFGNPLTSYIQVRDRGFLLDANLSDYGVNDISSTVSTKLSRIDIRWESAKGFFRFLLPSQFPWAQTLLQTQEDYLGKNFLGLIPISVIFLGMIFSLRFKSQRMEIIVILTTILAIIGIFSILSSSTRIVGRYATPAIPLFSILIGIIISKFFEFKVSHPHSNQKFRKNFKTIFLISLLIYFGFAYFISEPVQFLLTKGLAFKNPVEYSNIYPPDTEGLSAKNILVDFYGSKALGYGLIPFNFYWGYNQFQSFNPEAISNSSINILKDTINDDYDAYVLKEPQYQGDKPFFKYLINNYGFVLTDYSKTFCKLELIENLLLDNKTSDPICYEDLQKPIQEPKWYDWFYKK